MGIILDTCVWIEVERGNLALADIAREAGIRPVFLVPPVLAELEYGAHRAKTNIHRARRMDALAQIRHTPCLSMDKTTAEIFGRLAAALDASGKPAKHRVHDMWIAAVAIQHQCAVMTLNTKDFEDIPGLRLIPVWVLGSNPNN